ncbi:hypothetical protein [uncultured Propionibacterium sp.]|uniref:hypothetical protein n=1 Tax=uncultured Propionibacterium sp. TaxID=218066 RepID=UPI00292F9FC3|nr:hypothetical protein [uncultured Propionibacterium sp.]
MDKQQDSARTPKTRRARAALAGVVLTLGLLAQHPAAAETVPAQPAPQATASSAAASSTTAADRSGSTTESTVKSGSLSRKKTIAALILSLAVALVAAFFVFRRTARDNCLG